MQKMLKKKGLIKRIGIALLAMCIMGSSVPFPGDIGQVYAATSTVSENGIVDTEEPALDNEMNLEEENVLQDEVALNESSISGNEISVSSNEISVSENMIEESQNVLILDEDSAVEEENAIDEESVSGNEISVSGNEISVSGNEISVSGNEISVSGNEISVSANEINMSSDDTDINEESVSGNDVQTDGLGESVSANDILSDEGNPSDEDEEALSLFSVGGADMTEENLDEDGNAPEGKEEELWIAGFDAEDESIIYDGSKKTKEFQVYYGNKLLQEKTDYTVRYSNNTNAATCDSAKAPSVTITMKGQYSGSKTLYFTIFPRDLSEIDTEGYEQSISFAKKIKIPVPILYFKGKKLGTKDFTYDYSTLPEEYLLGSSYDLYETYEYQVVGTGNYTGTITMRISVVDNNKMDFFKATVKLNKSKYEFDGETLTQEDVGILSLKVGGVELDKSMYTYDVDAEMPGDGYVRIYPSDAGRDAGYRSCKEVKIKVVGDRPIKNVVLGNDWQQGVKFSQNVLAEASGFYQEGSNLLFYGEGEPLEEGTHYQLKYKNNVKAGTATVTITGMGRYTGSVNKTFKILPDADLHIEGEEKLQYTKSGWLPIFKVVASDGTVLKYKTDYAMSVKTDKKTGITTATITSKGNYNGYKETVVIESTVNGNLSGEGFTIQVNDKAYSSKKNGWKSTIVVKDNNGKTLSAGRDYDKNLIYKYRNGEEYILLTEDMIPSAGTQIQVTVKGINNYAGEDSVITGYYHIYSTAISKLIIEVDSQIYTGEEIRPDADDIHVYATRADQKAGIEMPSGDDHYEIIGYSNNIKAGTGKITLQGVGEYGSTKTYNFKITKKNFDVKRVTAIALEERKLSVGRGAEKTLTPKITPADAENQLVYWQTSNAKVATVDRNGVVKGVSLGKATITAVSRDTGKKATCPVEVVIIPVASFELKDTELTIEWEYSINVDTPTVQMELLEVLPAEADLTTVKWKSSNEMVASVDATGLVTLHNGGTAVITAYVPGENEDEVAFSRSCTITSVVTEEIPEELEGVDYVTPQEFRYEEDADDTASFERAIDSRYNYSDELTIYVPAGVYIINPRQSSSKDYGIRLEDNVHIIMSKNAVLMASPVVDSGTYAVILADEISNASVTGGSIIGERYEHMGTRGEQGMGVKIIDSTDITVKDVAISNCWGDGIYLGTSWDGDEVEEENPDMSEVGNYRIQIIGCTLDNNRRNGMSIICASDVLVDGCKITNANGTAPEAGICIEANYPVPRVTENITIRNSTITGNKQYCIAVTFAHSQPYEITVDGVSIEDCTLKGKVYNYSGTNVTVTNNGKVTSLNAIVTKTY